MSNKVAYLGTLLFAVLVFAGPVSAQECDLSGLQYYTEDFPPYNYKRDGVVTGSSVERLRDVWQHMGIKEPEIRVMPWARSLEKVLKHPRGVLFSCARTPDREAHFKWVCPFKREDFVLVGRKNDPHKAVLAGTIPVRVGVIRKSAEMTAVPKVLPRVVFDEAATFEQNVCKLNHGRVDYIVMSKAQSRQLLSSMEYSGLEEVIGVGSTQLCIAFNTQVPDCVIDRFRQVFATLDSPDASETLAEN